MWVDVCLHCSEKKNPPQTQSVTSFTVYTSTWNLCLTSETIVLVLLSFSISHSVTESIVPNVNQLWVTSLFPMARTVDPDLSSWAHEHSTTSFR